MAPLKFEDNIKDALSKRTIAPSPDSWNKLATKLDKDSGKKITPIWWAIAAGFVGLILISVLLFNNNDKQQQELVEEEIPIETILQNDQLNEQPSEIAIEEQEKQQLSPQEAVVKDQKLQVAANEESAGTNDTSLSNNKENPTELMPKENGITTEVAVINIKQDNTLLDIKVEQVVAQILNLKAQNSEITEAEVAALLNAAQRELKSKSLIDPTTQKVDAMALLDEVEFDLERTFRDKVFDALGDGFNKIRTAMAERNN